MANWMPLAIIVFGLATRFAFIWWPPEVVMDEVHFGKFILSYFSREFIFDIHPPLGKLLIASALWFAGLNQNFDFAHIGEPYGSFPYIAFRFFPNLFGGLLPFAVWWLAKELNFSRLAAFFAATLIVLDNALITHSHFVMLDAFMLFFGFAGLAAFLHARNKNYENFWLAIAGILLGLSISSKWTGASFLATAGLLINIDIVSSLVKSKSDFRFEYSKIYLPIVRRLTFLIILPILVYILIFAIHLNLLIKPGPGSAFMPQDFLNKNFFSKFVGLNIVMYTVNTGNLTPHPYSSRAYTWPIMLRSIYYWNKEKEDSVARIYLLGNPAIWWGSTFLGAFSLFFWWPREKIKKWLVVFLWIISFTPFLFVQRTTFLYHYFTSLIAAIILAAGWLGDSLPDTLFKVKKNEFQNRIKLFTILSMLTAALVLFVYFVPLTYGFYLTEEAFKSRLWLPGWL